MLTNCFLWIERQKFAYFTSDQPSVKGYFIENSLLDYLLYEKAWMVSKEAKYTDAVLAQNIYAFSFVFQQSLNQNLFDFDPVSHL